MLKKIKKFIWKHFEIKKILDTCEATHKGMLFSQATQDCPWLKNRGFSFGDFGWAMDAFALHNLFRVLEDVKPKNVLEFGLGQSSKMVHQYAEFYKANALTVEHDEDWINYIKTHAADIKFNIRQTDLEKITINSAETVSYQNSVQIFEDLENCGGGGTLIIVDGPFGQAHYSRPQILNFVPKPQEDFCIFMHDTERVGEQETLTLLCEKLERNGIEFLRMDYSSVKRHTIVCCKNWKFLTSL